MLRQLKEKKTLRKPVVRTQAHERAHLLTYLDSVELKQLL